MAINRLKFVMQSQRMHLGIAFEYLNLLMKTITDTAKHIKTQLVDWVLIKGPELFIAIYGK